MNKLTQLTRNFLFINDDMYEVIRAIKEDHNPNNDVWKEHLQADRIFRKEGILFFCKKIEEAIIVSDEETTNISNI